MSSEQGLGLLIDVVERGWVPDALVRRGIRRMCRERLDELASHAGEDAVSARQDFIDSMRRAPIALDTDAANEQHYELPAAFFRLVLGDHGKYSCCHWPADEETLSGAEASALRLTCDRAALEDGMSVLELGCGWGSLTLWMAEQYPQSQITAVSNSASQREYILERAAERSLSNIRVITADMNDLELTATFDRIVSIEMFEHMRNYQQLLGRIRRWLRPDGRLFVHVFCHRTTPYAFETEGASNWMGRYFFTGGIMPSADLLHAFDEDLHVEDRWRWDGRHYEKTANAWLVNLDRHRAEAMDILRSTYGDKDAGRWFNRWRVFFMACAELFGYDGGREWFVMHYLLSPSLEPAARAETRRAVGVGS